MRKDCVFPLCECFDRREGDRSVVRHAGLLSFFVHSKFLVRRVVNEGSSGSGVVFSVFLVRLLRLNMLKDRATFEYRVSCRCFLALRHKG